MGEKKWSNDYVEDFKNTYRKKMMVQWWYTGLYSSLIIC